MPTIPTIYGTAIIADNEAAAIITSIMRVLRRSSFNPILIGNLYASDNLQLSELVDQYRVMSHRLGLLPCLGYDISGNGIQMIANKFHDLTAVACHNEATVLAAVRDFKASICNLPSTMSPPLLIKLSLLFVKEWRTINTK